MTLDQFYARLQETPRDWVVMNGCVRDAQIRRGQDFRSETCPICEVAGVQGIAWWKHGKAIRLDEYTALQLVDAADNVDGHNPAIRSKLLAACGL